MHGSGPEDQSDRAETPAKRVPERIVVDVPRQPPRKPRVQPVGWQEDLTLPGESGSPTTNGPPPPRLKVPMAGPPEAGRIELAPAAEGRISLVVRDAPLSEVLAILATQQGVNIVSGEDVTARISVTLHDVTLEDALNALTSVGGYAWYTRNNIILVTSMQAEGAVDPEAQGRILQVFNLNYVTAADLEPVARGLISPTGKLFSTMTKPDDNRSTQEVIVVEDLPAYVGRVAAYIAQVDRRPRQVMIEGHVLSVALKDDSRHGVNWEVVAKAFGGDLTLGTLGFATPNTSPGSFIRFDGSDVNALLEALKSTTDAKTLAQPKVMCLNGQEARIQIGSRFGYLVTTTTQTSTVQNVNFLDVGVLLTVTPHISDDNHVLLSVKPEVSTGQINPVTQLPEQDTTEVETAVMLPDGGGVVIGGLIKEGDSDKQSKVPILGDLWLAGRFFQKRNLLRERSEIIIALVPRVLPYPEEYAAKDALDYMRATTPLMQNDLRPMPRPWEGQLPDAMKNPRRIHFKRLPEVITNLADPFPNPPEYYFPAVLEEEPWRREQAEFEAEP